MIIIVKTLSELVFWQEQDEELKESHEDALSPCKTLKKNVAGVMKSHPLNDERCFGGY